MATKKYRSGSAKLKNGEMLHFNPDPSSIENRNKSNGFWNNIKIKKTCKLLAGLFNIAFYNRKIEI